jgi:hypothetical protein
MGIWIEFRCENRSNPSSFAKPGAYRDRCWSNDNAGPMEMANETQADVIETLKYLMKTARETGWVKTKFGWICPYCAQQPTVYLELAAEASKLDPS